MSMGMSMSMSMGMGMSMSMSICRSIPCTQFQHVREICTRTIKFNVKIRGRLMHNLLELIPPELE